MLADCHGYAVPFVMIKNDGEYLDGSRLDTIPEWPIFETANNVSWLVYCSYMNRDAPSCDLHFKRKVYAVGAPAIVPLECKVSSHGQVSRSRVASAWLSFMVKVVENASGIAPVYYEDQARHALHASSRRQRGTVRRSDYTFRAGQESTSQPQDCSLSLLGSALPGRNEPGPEGRESPPQVPRLSGPSLVLSGYQTRTRVVVTRCTRCVATRLVVTR